MESESSENLRYLCAAQLETMPGLLSDVHQAVLPNMPQGVSGFLAWLMLWFRLCVEQSHRCSKPFPIRPYEPNRFWRRRRQRVIVPVRNNRPFYTFTRPETSLGTRSRLSPTQFMERLVALSGRGRVSVYRMRYWRKTVKGKAAPLGTEHEYWRDPISRMGKLLCGVWAAHLWPGWRLSFSN